MQKYNRSIKLYDEPHTPEELDIITTSRKSNSHKFVSENHAQSFLLQMQTIANLKDIKSVFELGPGENFCGRNLKHAGYDYTTLDFEPSYNPDIVEDWKKFNIIKSLKKYDLTCAFQVLEHFPWKYFHLNLLKLALLSKKYVFISIPYSCIGFQIHTTVHQEQGKTTTKISEFFFPSNLPQRRYRDEYVKEFPWAVHYWEIGREGISLDDIFNIFQLCNLEILDKFHSKNPYHYFILSKKLIT